MPYIFRFFKCLKNNDLQKAEKVAFFPPPEACGKRPVQHVENHGLCGVNGEGKTVLPTPIMYGASARIGHIAKGGHLKKRDIKNNVKYVARILSRFRHL